MYITNQQRTGEKKKKMKLDTFVKKGTDGFKATTTIPLEGTSLHLKLSTSKFNGMLTTTASCFKKDGMFESHRVYQDYHARIRSCKVRVTEKAVIAEHDAAKEDIERIIEAAKAHYSDPAYIARYGEEKAKSVAYVF